MPLGVRLTGGEKLWVWRHREGLNVIEAAERFKMSRKAYLAAEHGDGLPDLPTVVPTTSEVLRVLRHRSRKTRDELCAELGVCHVTWLKWERESGPDGHARLLDYWKKELALAQ